MPTAAVCEIDVRVVQGQVDCDMENLERASNVPIQGLLCSFAKHGPADQ